jgi:cell division septum initiation protein DivIVA
MRLKESYNQMLDHLEREVEKLIQDNVRLEKENIELNIRIKELEEELSKSIGEESRDERY